MFKRQPGKSQQRTRARTRGAPRRPIRCSVRRGPRPANECRAPPCARAPIARKWPLEQTRCNSARTGDLAARRTGPRRWAAPARALATGAVVLLAAAAGVGGLIWAAPDGPHDSATEPRSPSATPRAPAPRPTPRPKQAPEPTLHGAAPDFSPSPGRRPPPSTRQGDRQTERPKGRDRREGRGAERGRHRGAASAPTALRSGLRPSPGPPARPEAIAVARHFAETFVRYEIGGDDTGVRKAFKRPRPGSRKALLHRPPRQPANVKVPKAKVVNVVAGPSRGRLYPVSVSLLRVGVTSELRLEMERAKGVGWQVTNVLG